MANKAKKTKKSAASNDNDANVVRIKASSSPSSKKSDAKVTEVATKVVASKKKESKAPREKSKKGVMRPLRASGGYFKGAWTELRQVRWPNRRSTWSLTAAVLAYSAFFVILVLLLDAGFKYMFELILGK